MANNYVLGRGEIHFARFLPDTQTPEGFRYLGNTTTFNLNFQSTKLDHFSSDRGIKEKDDSVVSEVNRTGSLITDNIDPENVALFFFGDTSALTVVGATVTDEPIADIEKGRSYPLGVSTVNPMGARKIVVPGTGGTLFAVKKAPSTALVKDVDYTIDADTGMLTVLTTGVILVNGDDLLVTYTTQSGTRTRIISGSQAVDGALRFISQNPKGAQTDYYLPWVSLSPNGDYSLKGDAWQVIPFNVEVLKKTGYEALYAESRVVA